MVCVLARWGTMAAIHWRTMAENWWGIMAETHWYTLTRDLTIRVLPFFVRNCAIGIPPKTFIDVHKVDF